MKVGQVWVDVIDGERLKVIGFDGDIYQVEVIKEMANRGKDQRSLGYRFHVNEIGNRFVLSEVDQVRLIMNAYDISDT